MCVCVCVCVCVSQSMFSFSKEVIQDLVRQSRVCVSTHSKELPALGARVHTQQRFNVCALIQRGLQDHTLWLLKHLSLSPCILPLKKCGNSVDIQNVELVTWKRQYHLYSLFYETK